VRLEILDRFPVQFITPGGGLIQAPEDVHEGGFARAAGPADGHELAAPDAGLDPAQGRHRDLAHPIRLGKAAHGDDGGVRGKGAQWPRPPPPPPMRGMPNGELCAAGADPFGDSMPMMTSVPGAKGPSISVWDPSLRP